FPIIDGWHALVPMIAMGTLGAGEDAGKESARGAALLGGPPPVVSPAAKLQPPAPRPRSTDTFPFLVGEHPLIQRVHALIVKLAASAATVLITGESGTGKELAARGLHLLSAR